MIIIKKSDYGLKILLVVRLHLNSLTLFQLTLKNHFIVLLLIVCNKPKNQ